MCSATQRGLRVRRSKAEVVLSVGWRSFIGPGNPYWKRPLGWTGGTISLEGWIGEGTGAEVVLDGPGGYEVEVGVGLRSLREEKMEAETAAPVAADRPAIIAKVVLDMETAGLL